MNNLPQNTKGIIFDYGGTIDTDGKHWSEVIWNAYLANGVTIDKRLFRLAYVHGERSLAKFQLIKPEHNFLDLLKIKINIQTSFLVDASMWPDMEGYETERKEISENIAQWCYNFVKGNLKISEPVLRELKTNFPLVLVSNFYGNIEAVLNDFGINLFDAIIESSVVGVRKPNPEIFRLGAKALNISTDQILVIGDSYDKDIIPANSIGCNTIWLKGTAWNADDNYDESIPYRIITSINQL